MATDIENDFRSLAIALEGLLEDIYGKKMGFVVVAFPFGMGGIADYASNGKREDIIMAMRETAERLENNEDIPITQGGIQ